MDLKTENDRLKVMVEALVWCNGPDPGMRGEALYERVTDDRCPIGVTDESEQRRAWMDRASEWLQSMKLLARAIVGDGLKLESVDKPAAPHGVRPLIYDVLSLEGGYRVVFDRIDHSPAGGSVLMLTIGTKTSNRHVYLPEERVRDLMEWLKMAYPKEVS